MRPLLPNRTCLCQSDGRDYEHIHITQEELASLNELVKRVDILERARMELIAMHEQNKNKQK